MKSFYLNYEVGAQEVRWYRGAMYKVMKSFVCGGCMGPVIDVGCAGVDVGAGLELVDGFCCLSDMLGVDEDMDAAVEASIRVE